MLTTAIMVVALNVWVFTTVASFSCSKKAKPTNAATKPLKTPRKPTLQNASPQCTPNPAMTSPSNEPNVVRDAPPVAATAAVSAAKTTPDLEDKTQNTRSNVEPSKCEIKTVNEDLTQGTILKSPSEMKNSKMNKMCSEREETTLKSVEDDTQISASVRMADSEDTNEFVPDLKQDGNVSELESNRERK